MACRWGSCKGALNSTLIFAELIFFFFPNSGTGLLLFYKLSPHGHVQSDASLNYKVLRIPLPPPPSIWLHFSSMFSYNIANTIL